MFNPVSKANWVYKYFFESGTPDDTVVCHTTYKDNPHLPQSYIDSLMELEKRNPNYFKIYVLGEFATLDKLVFPKIIKEIIDVSKIKQNTFFWCGLDFGYVNDPSVLTYGYYDPTKKILYITGEYHAYGLTNDVLAKKIIELGLSKEKIIADSAEQKSIAELRNFGISRIASAVKGPDSIINGIDKISRCEIHVDERCRYTVEEFENYTWTKDKFGEYVNKPIDAFNHHIDSIRYGIQAEIKNHLT